jgi:hypothetical protein
METFSTEEEIPQELFEIFIKRRRGLMKNLVNFRRKQITKREWRTGRWKFLRGLHKFHSSIRGKRMHRALGRFLATRILRPHLKPLSQRYESLDPVQFEALKALSSYRTHLYIEGDYWQPLEEQADFFSLLEYAIPILNDIEVKLYNDADSELNEDEFELLLRLVDDRELCKSIAEVSKVSPEKVIDTHKAVTSNLIKQGRSSVDDTFFLTSVVEHVISSVVKMVPKEEERKHEII